LAALESWQPYFLVLAASSFVYVALADLIPQLQKRLNRWENLQQVVGIGFGVALIVTVSALSHHVLGAHAH
jgi:zinc and cadmium transporter